MVSFGAVGNWARATTVCSCPLLFITADFAPNTRMPWPHELPRASSEQRVGKLLDEEFLHVMPLNQNAGGDDNG